MIELKIDVPVCSSQNVSAKGQELNVMMEFQLETGLLDFRRMGKFKFWWCSASHAQPFGREPNALPNA